MEQTWEARALWEQTWGRYITRDEYGPLGEVVPVSDGWSARTRRTDLGVYLTVDMAKAAVTGMHEIEVNGSYYGPTEGPGPRERRSTRMTYQRANG